MMTREVTFRTLVRTHLQSVLPEVIELLEPRQSSNTTDTTIGELFRIGVEDYELGLMDLAGDYEPLFLSLLVDYISSYSY